ncbi:hypothetical protein PIROE2DRAFT_58778 [Piromyces sp. E2]|nr:hypothetical protein PIROE2DRAFT_58778 [Piromyces sp. E2]|eukprot:OUM67380.1 hypothetical protein PIROE2DRAFT_58778 [Piromyces sp. E2]
MNESIYKEEKSSSLTNTNEISIDINLITKKSKSSAKSVNLVKSSKSSKSVKSIKSSKSYDVNISVKKLHKNDSIKTSKSFDRINQKNEKIHENKIRKKKSKSDNTIDIYEDKNKEKRTEIYFDYSSLDNLKTRNNLLEPIQYSPHYTYENLNGGNDSENKNYKIINIDNNIDTNKSNKSTEEIIDNNNTETNESKITEEIIDINKTDSKEEKNTSDLEQKKELDKKEITDIKTKNKSKIIPVNEEDTTEKDEENYNNDNNSKEPLIDKDENNNSEDNDKEYENYKLSEEEEKKKKLIEHYLKMPVRKTGLQCPWSLKQIVGIIVIAYSAAVNYYLIFNGEYNKIPKIIVLTISF